MLSHTYQVVGIAKGTLLSDQAGNALERRPYVPPAKRHTPDAGVIQPLHCRRDMTRFRAPVKVAAINKGVTYLEDTSHVMAPIAFGHAADRLKGQHVTTHPVC